MRLTLRYCSPPCFWTLFHHEIRKESDSRSPPPKASTHPASSPFKVWPFRPVRASAFCPPHFNFLGGKTCSVMVPPNWWGFCTLNEAPFFLWEELRKREGRSCTLGEGRSNQQVGRALQLRVRAPEAGSPGLARTIANVCLGRFRLQIAECRLLTSGEAGLRETPLNPVSQERLQSF